MISRRIALALVATAALVSTAFQICVAQTTQSLEPQSAAPLAASASTAVPALVPFSGIITKPDSKPISGQMTITFLIFKDQEGGEPLFAETQAVTSDAGGHYKVQLGATLANGLPADLFATGEARWLEVQVAGQVPQPRLLMASVPYALKAADSATLGGLPASAFVLAGSKAAADLAATVSAAATTASTVTTTGGISGCVPEFTGASPIADSPIFVSGANVGIGIATPSATLDVNGTALVSGALTAKGGVTVDGIVGICSYEAPQLPPPASTLRCSSSTPRHTTQPARPRTNPRFEWQAEVTANNTAAPSATLNLLSSTTSRRSHRDRLPLQRKRNHHLRQRTDLPRDREDHHRSHRRNRPHRRRCVRQRLPKCRHHQSRHRTHRGHGPYRWRHGRQCRPEYRPHPGSPIHCPVQ